MSQLFDYFVVVGLVPLPPSPLDDDDDAVTFMPQVIDRYPIDEATDRCGYELPPTLPFFAIPEGAMRTAADGKPMRTKRKSEKDRFFTFVLTDGAGASYYGGCLQRFFPSTEGAALPRSICVLSRIPAYLAFRDVLTRLHVITGGSGALNGASKPFLQSFFNMSNRKAQLHSLALQRGVRLAPVPEAEEAVPPSSSNEDVSNVDAKGSESQAAGQVAGGWSVRGGMSRFMKSSSKSIKETEAKVILEEEPKHDDEEPQFIDVVVPEVLVNGKVSVKAPDGRQLKVQVPPNTPPGTTLRIPIPVPPKPKPKALDEKASSDDTPSPKTTPCETVPSATSSPSLAPSIAPPLVSTPAQTPTVPSLSPKKKQTTLMDLMTRRTETVLEVDKDIHLEWEFALLRVVFASGVVGIELGEVPLKDVPMKYHHAANPNTKTASILQQCHLSSEKHGNVSHEDNVVSEEDTVADWKEVDDDVLVAFISGVDPGCAAALMGFEAGDIIVEINDAPIRGDKAHGPAYYALRGVDASPNFCLTVLKRRPKPGSVLSKANAIEVPLENIISYLIDFTPIPPRGSDLVAKVVGGISSVEVEWSHGEVSPLPFLEPSCLAELAQAMETRDVVTLLEALLQEQRVCVLSSDVTQLTPVCEALRNLMFPLKWQHAYIPLLPKELLGYLEAPIPFIVGLDQAYLDEDAMVAEAVDSSAAVTIRLNQKHTASDDLWSEAVHVPEEIHFVSMAQHIRNQLISELEEAFIPFRTCRNIRASPSTHVPTAATTPVKGLVPKATSDATASTTTNGTAGGGYMNNWRLLGGGSAGSANQHPLSLSAAVSKNKINMTVEWRLSCHGSQRSAFQAIASVMSGYDQFLQAETVSKAQDGALDQVPGGESDLDPGALFDRKGFMSHHRSKIMKDAADMHRRVSQDGSPLDSTPVVHVAPISAKFAENIIHTQLFEAFIEECCLFDLSPEMVYFNKCCAGTIEKVSKPRKRALMTTSPITVSAKKNSVYSSYFCYGNFPRLDGAKLRKPPKCKHAPELKEPEPESAEEEEVPVVEEKVEKNASDDVSPFAPIGDMTQLDKSARSSPPQSRNRAMSRSAYRNSLEWNQTMDAKLLFGASSQHTESSGSETDHSEDEREEDADFYEKDFKVFTREESDMNLTSNSPSGHTVSVQKEDNSKQEKKEGEEAVAEVSIPTAPTPVASRWSRVSNFSLKSASQAAAAAASASASAVSLASAAAAKAKASARANASANVSIETPVNTDNSVESKDIVKDEKEKLDVEIGVSVSNLEDSPPTKVRPPLTKWDPSQRSSSSDGRSSLWDKSALALDSGSRNRFSQTAVRRRSSETSIGPPMSSPGISRRGSLRQSENIPDELTTNEN